MYIQKAINFKKEYGVLFNACIMCLKNVGESVMELNKLELLDAEITQINERCDLARKGQGWIVILILAYGMMVSLGQFQFNGLVFGIIVAITLGLFVWVHLMARELSEKFKECEGCM